MTYREFQSRSEEVMRRCGQSGESIVVEFPDQVTVRILPNDENDDFIDRLIENNTEFRELLEKSNASPLIPFPPPDSK